MWPAMVVLHEVTVTPWVYISALCFLWFYSLFVLCHPDAHKNSVSQTLNFLDFYAVFGWSLQKGEIGVLMNTDWFVEFYSSWSVENNVIVASLS